MSFELLRFLWFLILFLHFQCLSYQLISSGTLAVPHFSKNKNLRYAFILFELNWCGQTIYFINHLTKLIEKLFWVFDLSIIHFLNALIQIWNLFIDFGAIISPISNYKYSH
jgi:hypothetical protein